MPDAGPGARSTRMGRARGARDGRRLPGDAGEDDGHASRPARGRRRASAGRRGRRCRSPRPGCRSPRRARGPRRSPPRGRRAPGRRSAARRRARRASRTSRRRGSRRRPSAGRPTASSARPSGAAGSSATAAAASSARASGAQPLALHGVEPHAGAEPPPGARGERAAADLHDARGRAPTPASASSHPIVRPPSRHSAFSGPCTLNGTAPAATASRNRSTAGSPGGSLERRSHGWTVAPSDSRMREHRRTTPTSARTRRSASAARRASVAAAIAALPHDAMASGRRWPRRQAQRLGGDEVQQDRHEVAALVAAADVAGLVLDPHVGTERVGQRRRAGERRHREPVGQLAVSARRTPPRSCRAAAANAHHARRGP